MIKSMVAPATPPTMPPASTDAEGVLLPPDPPPELDVGEAAAAVVLAPPMPPAPTPVLEASPERELEYAWLDDCEGAEVDVNVADGD